MDPAAKKNFWEKKILQWEKARYCGNSLSQSWLERLVKSGGGSVAHRQRVAADLARPHLEGKILLDAGCGSGQVFHLLADAGVRGFVGVDLAENAINNARNIADRHGYGDRSTFLVGNITDVELPDFDIVILLGLLDWLSLEEIDQLFSRIEGKHFLASISERRTSVHQFLHRIYVFLAYGWRSGSYVPRYYPVSVILSLLKQHGFSDIQVYRDSKLSFGAILHNLPGRITSNESEGATRCRYSFRPLRAYNEAPGPTKARGPPLRTAVRHVCGKHRERLLAPLERKGVCGGFGPPCAVGRTTDS